MPKMLARPREVGNQKLLTLGHAISEQFFWWKKNINILYCMFALVAQWLLFTLDSPMDVNKTAGKGTLGSKQWQEHWDTVANSLHQWRQTALEFYFCANQKHGHAWSPNSMWSHIYIYIYYIALFEVCIWSGSCTHSTWLGTWCVFRSA